MTQKQRLDSLEPEMRELVLKLIERTEKVTGRRWMITDGRRTIAEQKALYAQGRSKPGKVVTKAKPGYSAHNYGLAADLAPLVEGGTKIDWNAPKSVWRMMADEAIKLGLDAGFYFQSIYDAPHVELNKWKIVKELWLAGKVVIS